MYDNTTEKLGNQKIIKGSIVAYLSLAVNILAGIVYTPWMVRQIGQSNYGLYTLAISITSILMFDFGIGSALSRFASQYRAKQDKQGLERFVGLVYKLYFSIDAIILIISSILFFFLGTIYAAFSEAELEAFRVVYIMVVSYNLFAFPFANLNGILGAYEEFTTLKGCELLTRVLTIILVVFSIWQGWGLYALVLSNILSGIIAIAIKWFVVRFRLRIVPCWGKIDIALLKSILSFSIWSVVMSVSTTLGTGLLPSVITALQGAKTVAIYGAANTLNGYAYLLTNAIGGMFFPKVTRLQNAANERARLDGLAIRVGRILGMLSFLILIGFFCVGEEFFVLWMGENYRAAYPCACFLLIGELAFTPFHIYDTEMLAKGIVKPQAILYLVTAIFMLAASIPLISIAGATGAGLVVGGGYTLRSVFRLVLYKKHLNIPIGIFLKSVYGKMIACVALILILKPTLNCFLVTTWAGLFLKVLMILTIYLFTSFIFCLDKLEKQQLYNFLKRLSTGRKL